MPTSSAGAVDRSGFTVIELLAVMTIIALAIGAVSLFAKPNPGPSGLKALALQAAARFREARNSAVHGGRERRVSVDVARRRVALEPDGAPLVIAPGIAITLAAAESEQMSGTLSGIRFFPNGSSTGGVLRLQQRQQVYEVRVNWLTGRVAVVRGF